MANLQLTLTTTREYAELYADTLSEAGALAVTLLDAKEEPIFEPKPNTTPLWGMTMIVGLFELNSDVDAIKSFLQDQLGEAALETFSIHTLPDQAWERVCMDQFHPMQFGQHLWICPSWEIPPDPLATTILLDPGLAFGTGTHPTTRLCLEWLDAHPPTKQRVLDYGCGSGILGIAALKLAASQVYAIDYDPQALQSTKDNAQKNGYTDNHIITLLPEGFTPALACPNGIPNTDLILANILTNPLITLAPQFAEWLKPNGQLVLSGILTTQIDTLLPIYDKWFENSQVTILEQWCRITFNKRITP